MKAIKYIIFGTIIGYAGLVGIAAHIAKGNLFLQIIFVTLAIIIGLPVAFCACVSDLITGRTGGEI